MSVSHTDSGLARVVPLLLGATLAVFSSGCAALAAQQKAVDDARAASYQLPPKEVYAETYAMLSAAYSIARESEQRGFIETEWKESTDYDDAPTRTRVSAEVLGEDHVRVVLRVTVERKQGENWVPEADAGGGIEDDLYVDLNKRLKQRQPVSS